MLDAKARIALLVEAQGASKAKRDIQSVTGATGKLSGETATSGKRMTIAQRAALGFRSGIAKLARAAKYGAFILGGLSLAIGKKAIDEWRDAMKTMNATKSAIKSSGGAANVTAKHVEKLAGSLSLKAGIDDEVIQQSSNLMLTFRKVRNEAGKNNKVFDEATRTALDMSAAYDQSLRSSTIQLGKALAEPGAMASALKRTGAVSNEDVERLKAMDEAGAPLIKQQKTLLKLINRAGVKGRAAAIADPFDKAKVAVDNLAEKLGFLIGPPIADAATKLAKFVNGIQSGTGAGGRFADTVSGAFNTVKNVVGTTVTAVQGYLRRNKDTIKDVVDVVRALAAIAKWAFQNVIWPVVQRVVPGVAQVIKGLVRVLHGVIDFVAGVFTGDWRRAWKGLKHIVGGALDAILGALKAITAPMRVAARGMWNAIKWPFEHIVKPIFQWFEEKVEWLVDKINWVVDHMPDLNPFNNGPGAIPKELETGPGGKGRAPDSGDPNDVGDNSAGPGGRGRPQAQAGSTEGPHATAGASRHIVQHITLVAEKGGAPLARAVRTSSLRDLLKEAVD